METWFITLLKNTVEKAVLRKQCFAEALNSGDVINGRAMFFLISCLIIEEGGFTTNAIPIACLCGWAQRREYVIGRAAALVIKMDISFTNLPRK